MNINNYDELYWQCDDSNIDEVRWAELLVQDGVVPPNIFNTFLWLENCRDRLKSPSSVLSLLEHMEIDDQFDLNKRPLPQPYSLERDWRGIDTLECLSSSAQNTNIAGMSDEEVHGLPPITNNPLEIFLRLVKRGHYPPPELLLSVTKAIDLYFIANGKLSLEEVFFDPPPSARQGNYSKRSVKRFQEFSYLDFHELVMDSKEASTPDRTLVNIEELALSFLHLYSEDKTDELPEDNLESFLRGYRRWRRAQPFAADT